MSWVECKFCGDYQIFTEFPFQIRRRSNKHIVKESIDKKGYVRVCINRKSIRKHRIIGIQFIPNPENLPQLDHIDRDKTNYHIENLRWVNNSKNQQNCGSTRGIKHEFFDEIPVENEEDIIEVSEYGNHKFENLYFADNYFYYNNGFNFKRANVNYDEKGNAYVYAVDTTGKHRKICYLKFKKIYGID
ncbi:HNH endonuclease [Methanobrevibacter sp.]|uniref:HNH endonuclease n=1 Tax=Methanobrevibacter sp. TaxID=66852 RepID=UPI0038667647